MTNLLLSQSNFFRIIFKMSGIFIIVVCFSGFLSGQTIFYQEDFESGTLSSLCVTTSMTPSQEQANSGSWSGKLTGVQSHYQGSAICLPGIQPGYISFWLYPTTSGATQGYFVIQDGTSGNTSLQMAMFMFQNGSNFRTVAATDVNQPASLNQWHRVEFKNINWNTKTFDLYYNEVLVHAGLGFRGNSTNKIDRIFLYNFNAATVYYDDIMVAQYEPPLGTDPPTAILTEHTTICLGDEIELTAENPLGTVYWFDDGCNQVGEIGTGNSITVSPTVTTTYFARNYDNEMFSETCASITITVENQPVVPTASAPVPDPVVCGEAVSITASGSTGNYFWYYDPEGIEIAETGANFNAVIIEPATFYLAASINSEEDGCISDFVPISVNVVLPESPVASAPPPIICGESATLNASGSTGNYVWYSDSLGQNFLGEGPEFITPELTGTTTFYVGATDIMGGGGETIYTFTNCGATGRLGPTQAQINAAYNGTTLAGMVTVSGSGIQEWTVPATGTYHIAAYGAKGGGIHGGLGAMMSGEFELTEGEILKIIVGQQGEALLNNRYDFSGGGGTFVADNSNQPLIVAGGGGGAEQQGAGSHGKTGTSGSDGTGGYSNATGGINGNGGNYNNQTTDGGAGFFGNGGSGNPNPAPQAFVNGGGGGCNTWSSGCGAEGGFGGGGASNRDSPTFHGAGGGGGYSGGGSAYGNISDMPIGGGGGSINNGSNQNNIEGENQGHGLVVITSSMGVGYTCLSELVPVTVEVILPEAPIVTTPPPISCSETAVITASGSTGNYVWYQDPFGENLLGEGQEFTTPNLTETTTFYVGAAESGGGGGQEIIYTFTNAGATGNQGPTQAQINSEYVGSNLDGLVTIITQGIQEWTVPATGTYRIEAFGGQGGNANASGGYGAYMAGDFELTAGEVIKVLVGQQGDPGNGPRSGGGGGSFVVREPYNSLGSILVIAGGGGAVNPIFNANAHASAQESGNPGTLAASSPGTNGNGGTITSSHYISTGAGFFTNGQSGTTGNIPEAQAFVNGGVGSFSTAANDFWYGGFGGGGGARGTAGTGRNGGGGGFSGGAAGEDYGGGGGSFNSGQNQDNQDGINQGHGLVIITQTMGGAQLDCISELVPVTVEVIPQEAPIVNDQEICQGEYVIITAGGSTGFYNWYADAGGTNLIATGSQFVSPVLYENTQYYVEAYSAVIPACVSEIIPVFVNVHEQSIQPAGIAGGGTHCQYGNVQLSIIGGTLGQGADWEWFETSCGGGIPIGNGPTITVNPTEPTEYFVRAGENVACPATNCVSTIVTVEQPPTAPTEILGETDICYGESVSLTAFGGSNGDGADFQWYEFGCGAGFIISNEESIIVTPEFTTTYFVRRVGTTSCTNTTDCAEITINVHDNPSGNAFVSSNYNGAHISCFGANDGTAIMNVSGGNSPYNYLWDQNTGNQTSAMATNLGAGTYSVTVTDVFGCSTSSQVTLIQPEEFFADIQISSDYNGEHISCFGHNDGSAVVNSWGGTGTANYNWCENTGYQNSAEAVGLGAGTYTVSVYDANNCGTELSVTLTQPQELIASASVTSDFNGQHISCFGASEGSLLVDFYGGTGSHSILWSENAGNATTATVENLPAGDYYVIITDDNNCEVLEEVTIISPDELIIDANVSSDYNGSHLSCFGTADGAVIAEITGGTGQINIHWCENANNAVTSEVTGLGEGTYHITATDINSCESYGEVTIQNPQELIANITVTSDYNGAHITCYGASDGIAEVFASGGTGELSYQWDENAGNQTSAEATGLSAGTYSVTVTDQNLCSAELSITLEEPDELSAYIEITSDYNGQHISCFGASDGSVMLHVEGGTDNISILWCENAQNSISAELYDLPEGHYTVTVTDVNGCYTIEEVTLIQPQELIASLNITSDYNGQHISCYGAGDAFLSVEFDGGTGEINIQWCENAGFATITELENMGPGNYSVTITDENLCNVVLETVIFQPDELSAMITVTSDYNGENISCYGADDSSLILEYFGGTGEISVQWCENAGFSTETELTNLGPGNYYVTVTDVNNCFVEQYVEITEPQELTANVYITSYYNGEHISCYGENDGTLVLLFSGGTGEINIQWCENAGHSNETELENLGAGIYTVTVTDINGCFVVIETELVEPPELSAEIFVSSNYNGQDVSCFGATDGSAMVQPTGGTQPISFKWCENAIGQVTAEAYILGAGSYTVTVTDSNGCEVIKEITLTEPEQITAEINVSSDYNGQNISCYGAQDGSALVEVEGGTEPYDYHWCENANNQNTAQAENLSAGTFYVTVTDVNGCSMQLEISLTEPEKLSVEAFVSNQLICYGDGDGEITVLIEGGTIDYMIDWEFGSVVTNESEYLITDLYSGIYEIVLNDANECTDAVTVEIIQPIPPDVPVLNAENVEICEGDSHLIDAGGEGATHFNVYDAETGGELIGTTPLTVNPIVNTTYYVEAENEYGCLHLGERVSVEIHVHPAPENPIVNVETYVICEGDVIEITAVTDENSVVKVYDSETMDNLVGTTPIEISPYISTVYYLQAVSDKGCTHLGEIVSVEVTVNYYPELYFWISDSVLYVGESTEIVASGAHYYHWSPTEHLSCDDCANPFFTAPESLTGDKIFDYILVATSDGCDVTQTFTIRVKGDIELTIPQGFSPNNDGIGDTWVIDGIDRYPNNELLIFNRWGNQITTIESYNNDNNAWDGKTKDGKSVPAGTYYYVLKLNDDDGRVYSGFVFVNY